MITGENWNDIMQAAMKREDCIMVEQDISLAVTGEDGQTSQVGACFTRACVLCVYVCACVCVCVDVCACASVYAWDMVWVCKLGKGVGVGNDVSACGCGCVRWEWVCSVSVGVGNAVSARFGMWVMYDVGKCKGL